MKFFPQQCFPVCARKKHLLLKQNVSEKVQKHFLLPERKKRFRCKYISSACKWETGKQCFRNNVFSFAGDFSSRSFVRFIKNSEMNINLFSHKNAWWIKGLCEPAHG